MNTQINLNFLALAKQAVGSIDVLGCFKRLCLVSSIALVLACGGGAGGAGSAPPVSSGAVATQLELSTSAPQLDSSGANTATIRALAKNASNVVVPGVVVAFTVSSGNLAVVNATTDANGVAIASVSVGSDKTNRTMQVTGSASNITSAVDVVVRGTTVSVSGPTAVGLASPVTLLTSVKDSAGNGIAGKPVSLVSSLGNGASKVCLPATCLTDSSGSLSMTYTPTGGADTVVLSAMGASATQNILAASALLTVSAAADAGSFPANEFAIGQANKVVTVKLTGTTIAYPATVLLSSTAGSVTPNSITLSGSGVASTVAVLNTNNSVGAGLIFAQHAITGGVSNTFAFEIVSRVPATISLQASPAVIPANLAGSNANKTTITAIVRDTVGNPVKGANVSFTKSSDTSSGSLQSPGAISDSAGIASTNYISGPNSASGTGVTISASVPGVTAQPSINVTVAQQALFVNLGFGSVLTVSNTTEYSKDVSISVTDAAGQAVSGANVVLQLRPYRFFKGEMVEATEGWGLLQRDQCASEDTNNNGTIEGAEDFNNNGRLDPGIRPVITQVSGGSTPGTTNTSGFAYFKITYHKSDARWSEYAVIASSNTAQGGAQGNTQTYFRLPIAAPDVADKAVSPPNLYSPFGRLASCSNPN